MTNHLSKKFELYCDGGWSGKHGSATWGFVIVQVQDKVRSAVAGFMGSVITDHEHPEFIGADKLTNQTAELSALNWSLRWLSAKRETIPHATIFSDSTYAIRLTDSSWKEDLTDIEINLKLIENNRLMYDKVMADMCWIKGHSGNQWNGLADMLAQKAKKSFGKKAKRQQIGKKKLELWIPEALSN